MRGINITRTRHVPSDVPRTALPANLHRVAPAVMLIRIVPCDLRGMARPAAAAMRAADSVRNLRTVNSRCADVDGDVDAARAIVDVVVGEVTAGAAVTSDTATVVGTAVVGAAVVGATVVGAAVVVDDTVSEETVTAADRSTRSFTPS